MWGQTSHFWYKPSEIDNWYFTDKTMQNDIWNPTETQLLWAYCWKEIWGEKYRRKIVQISFVLT